MGCILRLDLQLNFLDSDRQSVRLEWQRNDSATPLNIYIGIMTGTVYSAPELLAKTSRNSDLQVISVGGGGGGGGGGYIIH